jgi:predicted permease
MATLLDDLRLAVRALRRAPGFTAVVVLTLALGVGANAALFSVVDALLLRPLPFREPSRLVAVWPQQAHTQAEFVRLREPGALPQLVGVAAHGKGDVSLTGVGEPVRLSGVQVSAGWFELLGLQPRLGRTFTAEEERAGAPGVVVLSHALWANRFGGDAGVLGRAVSLDGRAHTVVGVLPPGVDYPLAGVQVWRPIALAPEARAPFWASPYLEVVGRLGGDFEASRGEADARLRALAEALRRDNPVWTPAEEYYGVGASLVPLQAHASASLRPLLLLLLGAVGLVLLVACANVANLQLVRGLARGRELAVRAALGAGRGALVRQLLAESVLLALLGGLAGLLLASWSVDAVVGLLPPEQAGREGVGLDGRVLAFTAALALLAGLLSGLVPALRASRPDIQDALKRGGGGVGAGATAPRRLARGLVVAELALAVLLAAGAGLLVRSFHALSQVEPGFATTHVLTARLDPPVAAAKDPVRLRQLTDGVLARLAALPGVEAAGVTSQLPFDQEPDVYATWVDGFTSDPNRLELFDYRRITPGALEALGIPLLRGRAFAEADGPDAPLVALVDAAAAERYWPGQEPVGKRLRYPWGGPWLTVVGVVGGVKNNDLAREALPAFYVPYAQRPGTALKLAVRTTAAPEALAASLRAVVAEVDAGVPVGEVAPLSRLVEASLGRPRLATLLFALFALLALGLGALGVYGVLAHEVGQRTRELGIRMALGARGADVLGLVVRQALGLAAAGVAAGLAGALAGTQLLSSLLYGVGARDPLTFALVPLVLLGVALLAALLPARRATAVDPTVALRAE